MEIQGQQKSAPEPSKDPEQPAAPKKVEKVYLAVPYDDKDEAKALGAKWDGERKSWYAPGPEAARKLSKWLPLPKTPRIKAVKPAMPVAPTAPTAPPREEFTRALQRIGFVLSGAHPIMDGKRQRTSVEGDRHGEAGGFYVGYTDGHPNGYGKNNRTGEEVKWKTKGFVLKDEQKASLAAESAAKLEARAETLRIQHDRAAERVEWMLKCAVQAKSTPYLERKQVSPTKGVFVLADNKTLLVPGYDATGKARTAQYINEDGTKRYAKESSKEGCFHVVGGFEELARRPAIVIAEGYSTAATISEALGIKAAVVSSFDAGNLEAVARALYEKFPDKPILMASDDDHQKRTIQGKEVILNPGRSFACQAAKAIDAEVTWPLFAPGEQMENPKRFSDFNDLKVNSQLGMQAVNEQLKEALAKIMERHLAKEREKLISLSLR
jgi:putative DNA primase/helicase